jgi:hypothetical protein
MSAADHSAAYREHRARAIELRIMIDCGLVEGMDAAKHRRLVEELSDEEECKMYHYVEARRLRQMYGGEDE